MRIGRREVALTNLDKVFFPDVGLTKGDLVRYYVDVAPCLLHHVARRPMHMKRYPHGVEGEFFHQKRVPVPHPEWLRRCTSSSRGTAARPTSPSSRTPPASPGSPTSAASSCTRGTRGWTTSSGPTICSSTSTRARGTRGSTSG